MQRMTLITLAFALAANPALADLKDKLETLNKLVHAAGEPNADLPCANCPVYPSSATPQKVRACVESICPKSLAAVVPVFRGVERAAARPNAAFDRDVGRLVKDNIRANLELELSNSELALDYLAKPATRPSPGAARVSALLSGMSKVQLIEGELSQYVNTINSKDPDLKGHELTLALKLRRIQDAERKKAVDWSQKSLAAARLYKSDEQILSEVRADVKKISAEVRQLSAADPELKFLRPIFERQYGEAKMLAPFAKGRVDVQALHSLEQTKIGLGIISRGLKDPEVRAVLDAMPAKELDAETRARLKAEFTRKRDLLKQTLSKPIQLSADKCRYAFELAHATLPTRKKAAEYQGRLTALQTRFAEGTKDLVCPEKRAEYLKQAKDVTPRVSDTIDDFENFTKTNLRRDAAETRATVRMTQAMAARGQAADSVYLVVAKGAADYKLSTEDTDDICEPFTPEYIPDMAGDGKHIIVGPMVLKDWERNQGITNHELAHQFDFAARKLKCAGLDERLRDIEKCLITNHPESNEDGIRFQIQQIDKGQPSFYRDEDLADLLSEATTPGKDNFACSFFGGDQDEDYANQSLVNFDYMDTHSSNLFRLLHINFLRTGEVPKVCRDALGDYGQTPKFRNCLKETGASASASHR